MEAVNFVASEVYQKLFNNKLIQASGCFLCHARVGGHPGLSNQLILDSRLRGNDTTEIVKLPDPSVN